MDDFFLYKEHLNFQIQEREDYFFLNNFENFSYYEVFQWLKIHQSQNIFLIFVEPKSNYYTRHHCKLELNNQNYYF